MKIMTIGAGFVADHLPYERIKERLTLSAALTRCMLEDHKPDVLINCIGKTGRPNVDWCESNKDETAIGNTVMPILLAGECAKQNVHLIQIGSGCIYFGESPNYGTVQANGEPIPEGFIKYGGAIMMPCRKVDSGWREDDFANPKSFYSKTKYACDLMLGSMPHVTTLRIRMPISTQDNPRNLINKLKGYKQVIDIPNSVTFMSDLVRCIDWAAKENHTGIFHVTNPQPVTAAEVMREYQKYMPTHSFEIINEAQLDSLTVAKRSNCIIDSSKLRDAGFTMTPSKEALEACMKEYFGRANV